MNYAGKMKIKEIAIDTITPYNLNNKVHTAQQIDHIANSIKEFGFTQPIVIDKNNVIIIGHWRLEWAKKLGLKKVPVVMMDDLTETQVRKLRILDNKLNESEWDMENLKVELAELPDLNIGDLSFSTDDLFGDLFSSSTGLLYDKDGATWISLAERFIIPPFSIFDAKQGYRMERKRKRRELIKDNGESRKDTLGLKMLKDDAGVSLLDPVLAESLVRFFCVDKGTTFDPFAWDTVFGFVSWYLWYKFLGIELRKEQAELNQKRCKEAGLDCTYYNDTSENMDKYIPNNSVDMVFTCPPYRNLEKYSDDPNDLSNKSKDDFFYTIKGILSNTYNKLKNNRFACVVIGEVRDKDGEYINFVGETISIMIQAWYKYYNEIILATPIGSTAIRCWRVFNSSRKIWKIHQNVLVFYKGDIKQIQQEFKELDFSDLNLNEIANESTDF